MERFESIKKLLEDFKNTNEDTYTFSAIEGIANAVLQESGFYPKTCAVPIVKIANEFGIEVYDDELDDAFPSTFRRDNDVKILYDCDKVILVKENESIFSKRFWIAHELAHYLFEYNMGDNNEEDLDKCSNIYRHNKPVQYSYHKDHHSTPEEQRANRFAAAILMPEKLFRKQFEIARKYDSRIKFAELYLSMFFEVPCEAIKMRFVEIFGSDF